MEIKPKKIESIQYVGSVSHFRAWMDRFLSLGRGRMFFPFPDNERDLILKQTVEENNKAIRDSEPYRIIFDMSLWSWQLHIRYSEKDKDANREVWYVHLYDPTVSKTTFVPDKRASILAVEQSPNNTIVEFLDGVTFRNGLLTGFPYEGMIGDMFSNYAKFIKDEWEGKTKILDQKLHADAKTNENESSSGDVFISYSHKDKEYAHELAIEFERYLLKPWIDDRINYGTTWPQVVQDNLNACPIFVVIMSQNAYQSAWVQNEVMYAQMKRKRIFPLLLEGETWLSLAATQHINVRDKKMPAKDFFTTIKNALEGQRDNIAGGADVGVA